jgi:hypothetical protein
MRDLGMKLFLGFVVAAVIGIMSLIGYAIYYEVKHPCLRTAPGTCTSTYCTAYDADFNCMIWDTAEYLKQALIE